MFTAAGDYPYYSEKLFNHQSGEAYNNLLIMSVPERSLSNVTGILSESIRLISGWSWVTEKVKILFECAEMGIFLENHTDNPDISFNLIFCIVQNLDSNLLGLLEEFFREFKECASAFCGRLTSVSKASRKKTLNGKLNFDLAWSKLPTNPSDSISIVV